MLPKKNLLKKKKDFDNIFKKGKTMAGKLVFLRFLKNNLEDVRVGFIVSSKISKKAVIRNKIKRRLREIFKNNINNIKKKIDIIIIAKPEIVNKNYQDIKNDIEKLIQNI
jgi:ribonuclease P protein component